MSMLSGLTSTDDDSFGLEDYEELSEDCSNRSSVAQRIDISKDTFCTLVQALNTLDNNTKIKVLESLANVDSSVRDVIGYDTKRISITAGKQIRCYPRRVLAGSH